MNISKYDCELNIEDRNSLSVIISKINPNSTILEFGPANGRMSKYLKEKLNCKVYGVEIDINAAKDAVKYSERVIVGNIENYTWLEEYKNIKFDYIIFADVLEHLYYPEKVLTKSKVLLKENGSILMSIPNIAHNAIIIELLNNKFTYQDTGLLDNTHIRFFTKNSLDDFIKTCGLEIEYETGIYINPKDTEFKCLYPESTVSNILKDREYGEVYQFIIEAKEKTSQPLIELSQKYYAHLYMDTGNGFNEIEKERTSFFINDKKIVFELNNIYKNIKSLRLDPLEQPLVISINNIIINDDSPINNVIHNGVNNSESEIKFLHNDPYFILDFKEEYEIKKVTLNYNFLRKNIDLNKEELQELKTNLSHKDEELQNMKSILSHKDDELQNIKYYSKDLEQHSKNLTALAESMRLINRLKKLLPHGIKSILKRILSKLKRGSYLIRKLRHYVYINGLLFTLKQVYFSRKYKGSAITFKNTMPSSIKIKNSFKNISIVIPTYNGLRDLTKLIPQLLNQEGFQNIEIIVIDSSSQDGTKEFIENFPDIKLVIIEQKDFSHSYARNLGFDNCSAEIVLFMVQDALPTSKYWLHSFTHIFKESNISALSCIQIPNAEADLYTCYGLKQFNNFLDVGEKKTKITKEYIDNPLYSRKLAQLDNVSCLVDSKVFKKYKFRGKYAEDLDLGLRLIKDNYQIGITSEISVVHSHLRSAYYYMKRSMVETEVVKEMFLNKSDKNSFKDQLSDILITSYMISLYFYEIKQIHSPITLTEFKMTVSTILERLINYEYSKKEHSKIYKILHEYDEDFIDFIDLLSKNDVELKKGDLFYSIHHVNNEAINFIEDNYIKIDKKIISEYILFILNTFATQVGVSFGLYQREYLSKYSFLVKLFNNLKKGV